MSERGGGEKSKAASVLVDRVSRMVMGCINIRSVSSGGVRLYHACRRVRVERRVHVGGERGCDAHGDKRDSFSTGLRPQGM